MKEFVEKLIGRLEKQQEKYEHGGYDDYLDGKYDVVSKDIEIVNELAEEYNNGWIACSERLPKKSGKYLITQERYSLEDRLCKRPIAIEVDYVEFNATDNSWARARFFKVIAWQPLPAPYKEGEQNGR